MDTQTVITPKHRDQPPYCVACIYAGTLTGPCVATRKGTTRPITGPCTHAFSMWFSRNLIAYRATHTTQEV